MKTPDFLYLALIAIGLSIDGFVLWPTFLRRSQVDPARARLRLWSSWMCMLWTLVAAGIALWLFEERAWAPLRFNVPRGWRFLGSIALVLAFAIANARTITKVARSKPSRRIRMPNHAAKMAPHTRSELGWFVALSLSAGICEEFIFRAYLIWAFQSLLGLGGAAALSIAVFAAAHAYQGARGVIGTGVVGVLLTLVVLISGSLLPAIVLHALIDIGQGFAAWLVLREDTFRLVEGV